MTRLTDELIAQLTTRFSDSLRAVCWTDGELSTMQLVYVALVELQERRAGLGPQTARREATASLAASETPLAAADTPESSHGHSRAKAEVKP